MSGRYDVDRQVSAWLVSERPPAPAEGLLEAVIREVALTPRRPGWRMVDRWAWRRGAQVRAAARTLVMAVVLAAVVAVTALLLVVGAPRPAPPFGLTRAGLIAFDSAEGIVVGRADGTDHRVVVSAGGDSVSPTWSRDGLLLAYWHRPESKGSWSLLVVRPDGGGSSLLVDGVTLASREADFAQPSNIAWSPDSRRIAFAADTKGGQGIFVAIVGQTGATLITDAALLAIDPAWRPDGSVIAFQSERTGTLHVVAPDGTGEHQLNALPNTFLWPDWAPDGSAIATAAFVAEPADPQTGQIEVFSVSADGAVVTNVSRDPADDFSPTWSPDGRALAWGRVPADGSARAYIVIARLDTQTVLEIRVEADLAPPVWAPDGSRIFSYVQGEDGVFNALIVIDPNGIAPVVRLPAEGNVGNGNWQRLP